MFFVGWIYFVLFTRLSLSLRVQRGIRLQAAGEAFPGHPESLGKRQPAPSPELQPAQARHHQESVKVKGEEQKAVQDPVHVAAQENPACLDLLTPLCDVQ